VIKVGVVGFGYWGPNLVRNFLEAPGSTVTHVADLDQSRLERARTRYPSVQTTADPKELTGSSEIDCVAIATPVSTHFDLAIDALRHRKHVLVEKPLAGSAEKCERLLDEADSCGRVLMVDHTFTYTGAVRKIQGLIREGELGDIYFYDSVRVNLGLFQHDVSVIWDLAVHDLSIMDFLLAESPVAVSATGANHVAGQPENLAYLTVFFSSQTIGHIHVNWLAPVKVRQTLIGGTKRMIVYDDLEPTEKVKVYDKGVTLEASPDSIYEMRIGYRTGDMWAPKVDDTEALQTMVRHFIHCVSTGETPITGATSGMRVVRLLEAATRSMARRGAPVEVGKSEIAS
jgi:predicted dehydrogenase